MKLVHNGLEVSKHGLDVFSFFHTEEFTLTDGSLHVEPLWRLDL